MVARTSGSVQGIVFLLVLPLSFGSNTFVSVNTMPGWLQAFVKVNPISHLVSTVRGLMLGGPVASNLAWMLGWMAALLAIFVPLALRGYRRRGRPQLSARLAWPVLIGQAKRAIIYQDSHDEHAGVSTKHKR